MLCSHDSGRVLKAAESVSILCLEAGVSVSILCLEVVDSVSILCLEAGVSIFGVAPIYAYVAAAWALEVLLEVAASSPGDDGLDSGTGGVALVWRQVVSQVSTAAGVFLVVLVIGTLVDSVRLEAPFVTRSAAVGFVQRFVDIL
ncbi:hypothetical protein M758_11G087200 [Ceratodon purpureus]|nr:hypothetical protein M758_11G087200 [Ceratodon purpureus]